jgi:hypothetical protein
MLVIGRQQGNTGAYANGLPARRVGECILAGERDGRDLRAAA